RSVLHRIIDIEAKALAVAEKCSQQLGKMPHRHRDASDFGALQLAQDYLENRHVTDGHQRLGKHGRIRPQSLTFSTREYHCTHRWFSDIVNIGLVAIQMACKPFYGATQSF